MQKGVRKQDIEPYAKQVRELLKRRPKWKGHEAVDAKWAELVSRCRVLLDEYYREGKAMNRHSRKAAETIVALADDVSAHEILVTVAGMYLLADDQPKRFLGDRSFAFQMVRRVLGMTKRSRGSHYNHKTGKTHHVYRTPAQSETLCLFALINPEFGPLALSIVKAIREKEARRWKATVLEKEAISEMIGGV